MKNEIGLHQRVANNPEKADRELWGRVADPVTRRGFIKGLGTMSALLGAEIVFAPFMPLGLIPIKRM